jgi:energy-coupling factor transport system permease protein
MFNTVIGKYVPINSRIHYMSSISKIICLLLFLILLLFDNYILLIILTLLTITLILLSKVPLKLYLKSISNLKVLIAFLLLITLIFGGSWYQTITSIIKILLGILYTMLLTFTTSKSEITFGLEKVFSPLKIIRLPIEKISLSITLAMGFIPTIFDQTHKIMKSQASRGIDFNHTSLKGKVIAISSMMVPMFILTFKKSDAIADAMEVRMYDYKEKRTSFRPHRWHNFDENLILFHLGLLLFYTLRMILS